MNIERRQIKKDEERDILIGMIISDQFLKAIQPVYKQEFFTLPYTKIVSSWIMKHFEDYGKNPGKEIATIFDAKKIEIRDGEQIESIELFLEKLSERYEETDSYNIEYNVDRAVNYFKARALDNLIDDIKLAKSTGDLAQAEAAVSNFKRVEKGQGEASSIWFDVEEAIQSVRADEEHDIIVRFPGELGKVLRPITPDDYVAFIGPPKRGKSWWLLETAILASLNKKNVLFVTLEMPKKQLRTRIYQRITGQVVGYFNEFDDNYEVEIPYFDSAYQVTGSIFKRKEKRDFISARSVMKKMESIQGLIKNDNFKILEFPANTMSGEDLERHLDNLEHYDGFIPQIIIVDYADIMRPLKKEDHRNSINARWEYLRTIGQARKCAMVTVSHTVRATLTRDCREDSVVEDVRKLSHISYCIGINQLQEDKDNGVQRLSVLIDRFNQFNPSKEAVVTQCLDIGAVYLDSRKKIKGGYDERSDS